MTMRVAIYARYSTDLQDRTSISGQYRNCEELAQRRGFRVVAKFADEAVSGTDDSRPGFQRLLTAAARADFDGILIDETSRLTRNPAVLMKFMDELAFRNQFLLDCKGFDTREPAAALLAGIYGGLDRIELENIKRRTHRGLRERHAAGFSTGGKIFGYRSEPAEDGKRRRSVDLEQARTVREIFQFYADGWSPKRIAAELNRRGVPSPGSYWKRTTRRRSGWMHTALVGTAARGTGILRNELYVGREVWNKRRSKRVPGTSRRVFELRPQSEWLAAMVPELAIVSQDLWDRVQRRLNKNRTKTGEKIAEPRSRGRQPRYLLSGLLKCGTCGANFIMENKRSYVCSSRTNGGQHACKNNGRVRRDVAESHLLGGLKSRLLTPQVLRHVRRRVHAQLCRLQARATIDEARLTGLRRRQGDIKTEIEHVADAIASFGMSEGLRNKLRTLERESVVVNSELAEMTAVPIGARLCCRT
jgi:DNA invertase Pin-like site-specific DNA recombinase